LGWAFFIWVPENDLLPLQGHMWQLMHRRCGAGALISVAQR